MVPVGDARVEATLTSSTPLAFFPFATVLKLLAFTFSSAVVVSVETAGLEETLTSSAGSAFSGFEGSARFDGRFGFGAGDCALSASVAASVAARSAALEASCAVDGASGEVAEGFWVGGGGGVLEVGADGSEAVNDFKFDI